MVLVLYKYGTVMPDTDGVGWIAVLCVSTSVETEFQKEFSRYFPLVQWRSTMVGIENRINLPMRFLVFFW